MSMDRDPMKVSKAMELAAKYYDEDTYAHVMRVAGYVAQNMTIPYEYRDECVALAICHDLIEDTKCSLAGFPDNFGEALKLLSKPKGEDYVEYCKRLRPTRGTHYQNCAYWVKLADMKDHLTLTDTLTDRLKEKYLVGLAVLLQEVKYEF